MKNRILLISLIILVSAQSLLSGDLIYKKRGNHWDMPNLSKACVSNYGLIKVRAVFYSYTKSPHPHLEIAETNDCFMKAFIKSTNGMQYKISDIHELTTIEIKNETIYQYQNHVNGGISYAADGTIIAETPPFHDFTKIYSPDENGYIDFERYIDVSSCEEWYTSNSWDEILYTVIKFDEFATCKTNITTFKSFYNIKNKSDVRKRDCFGSSSSQRDLFNVFQADEESVLLIFHNICCNSNIMNLPEYFFIEEMKSILIDAANGGYLDDCSTFQKCGYYPVWKIRILRVYDLEEYAY